MLQALKKQYEQAAKDVQGKIHIHDNKIDIMLNEWDELDDEKRSILQSQIYQKKFQQQLKAQIDETFKKLNDDQYKSIQEYLNDSYTTAASGAAYDLHGQGIPLIMPIDRKAMLNAVELDPKLSKKLYGSYMDDMKASIRAEISRGIATADSYEHIARNITNKTNQSFNKTMRIVRTEGHRIQVEATVENMRKAIKAGADIAKQWDAFLDGKTRPSHRRVDGEIREFDDKFSNGMMWPADERGGASEVINCRCVLLQRARWALDDDELETLKKRAEYFGLDKTKDFEDFKKKYLKAAEIVAAGEAAVRAVATGAAAASAARAAKAAEKAAEEVTENAAEVVEISAGSSIISANGKDLSQYVGQEIVKTDNLSIREWYFANVHDIPNQIDKSKPLAEQAQQAYELRIKYKRQARAAMADKESADYLEEKRPVKSFEELVEDKMKRKGMTREEALEDIIKTSSKTNEKVDKEFNLKE